MTVLFMTVGIGKPDPTGLAHELAFCIKESRANDIILFGSSKSRETIPYIETSFREQTKKTLPHNEFIELSRIYDLHPCFSEIKAVHDRMIKEDPDVDIIINYNSGTKSMTSAMNCLALLTHSTIFFVEGERDNSDVIIVGTERIMQQTLYPVYDEMLVQRAIQYFNRKRYGYAIQELSGVCRHPRKENLLKIFSGYDLWDQFSHREAYNLLKNLHPPENQRDQFEKNRMFLNKLLNSHVKQERYLCVLVDLINNAQRRYDEGRYDDAVARLYRAFELCAQVMFLSAGLDDIEKKISFAELESRITNRDHLNRYKDYLDGNNVLVGCKRKYQLLQDIGVTDAMRWQGEMQNLLNKRNESIYAHGITPVEKETAEKFLAKMNDFVKQKFKDVQQKNGTPIEELFSSSRFLEIDS
ncbi:MAG: TIGR02710 family CRISPR-associated CARF protein [Methanoregula sp.]|nr:TIGR02710 family CRISPR-associated CARF protein [Methanoregula sp.]